MCICLALARYEGGAQAGEFALSVQEDLAAARKLCGEFCVRILGSRSEGFAAGEFGAWGAAVSAWRCFFWVVVWWTRLVHVFLGRLAETINNRDANAPYGKSNFGNLMESAASRG